MTRYGRDLGAAYEAPKTSAVSLDAAARTDAGAVRKVNEDSVLARRPIFVLADGMGGHDAGDRASAAAIEPLASLAVYAEAHGDLIAEDVDGAIDAARVAVAEIADETERGAGCTLTGAVLVTHDDEPCWYIVNIGDSRVYAHSGATLQQVTNDHSLHAEMIAAGREDANLAPRNVITRALGSDDARHDSWLIPVINGTRLLICSDGLTNEVDDEELRGVLTAGGQADRVADDLVRRAVEAGGRDNISVIVIDVLSGGESDEPSGAHAADEDDDTVDVTKPVR